MQSLSVIITSYDTPELAVIHARESMNSSHTPDEVIVVNDAGPPELKDMLKKLDKKCKLIYARINEDIAWNYTGARNLGIYLSTGKFVSVEDVDNIPSCQLYKVALEYFDKHPEIDRLKYGQRVMVDLKDALENPSSEWKRVGKRPSHDDTVMSRRKVYLASKGHDERFAGKYAWACSEWRRRLDRLGFETSMVTQYMFNVHDAETKACECGEEGREMVTAESVCAKCGKLVRRKSYENYELASDRSHSSRYIKLLRDGEEQISFKGHTQSPIGIMNFTYEYEEL